jgi:hypothetical protein
MSDQKHSSAPKRRRFTPIAITTGVLGALLLSASLTGSLAGFTASITNSTNTAASGTLVMQESNSASTPIVCTSTDGGSINTNTSTCAGINKLGGSTTMVPGVPVVTNISIKNVGTANAGTFTLAPTAACAQSNNGAVNGSASDLCSKLTVVITSGATTVFSGTAAQLGTATAASFTMPAAPAASVSVPFVFTVTLLSTAGNTYQGLSASVPLIWTFTS